MTTLMKNKAEKAAEARKAAEAQKTKESVKIEKAKEAAEAQKTKESEKARKAAEAQETKESVKARKAAEARKNEKNGKVKKKPHFTAVAVSVIFVLLISVLFAVTIFQEAGDDFSYYENRTLAEFPKFTKKSVLSGKYFTDVETYLSDHAPWRSELVELNTWVDIKIGRPVVNDVVITDDVLLEYRDFESAPDQEKLSAQADVIINNISTHKNLVESYGGHYCYVAVPCQYVCLADYYPWYLENSSEYAEASSSTLFEKMEQNGISYIDMKPFFDSLSGDEKLKYSSTVDNHYSMKGAYETYLQMMNYLNDTCGAKLDVIEDGEYTIKAVKNTYLGSRGRKLFNLWKDDEKLYTITPDKEINFDRTNNSSWGASVVYSLPKKASDFALYNIYMDGDKPETTIDTHRGNLPTVLIYGDSFTNPLECLIYYSFDKMYSIDLRHYTDKTLDEYINDVRPDYVFCVRDYDALLNGSGNGQ